MNQKVFNKIVDQFSRIEDARDQLWDRARVLMKSGYELEAYILILATWNFANFRYIMKTFNLRRFSVVITRVNPVFRRLASKQFNDINFTDKTLIREIKFIYTQLKSIAKQTGASKLMALNNPNLFIMWDTEIRRMYKIDNKGTATDYVKFLLQMHQQFENIKWYNKNKPLAKAIDEYNYVLAERTRRLKKNNKLA